MLIKFVFVSILILLIILGLIYLSKNKNEKFEDKPSYIDQKMENKYLDTAVLNRNPFYTFLGNGLKETPVERIDAIETKRFPFVIENTTCKQNSDSPILHSGNVLGTDIGKENSGCIC